MSEYIALNTRGLSEARVIVGPFEDVIAAEKWFAEVGSRAYNNMSFVSLFTPEEYEN